MRMCTVYIYAFQNPPPSLSVCLTFVSTRSPTTYDVTIFPTIFLGFVYRAPSLPLSPLSLLQPRPPPCFILATCFPVHPISLLSVTPKKLAKTIRTIPPPPVLSRMTDNLFLSRINTHPTASFNPFAPPVSLILFTSGLSPRLAYWANKLLCPSGDAICRYRNLPFTIT